MPTFSSDDCGIVYVATTERHLREAELSIRTVQAACDLDITLFTQLPTTASVSVTPIYRVQRGFADKVALIPRTPYQRTLFLDTDVVILRNDFIDLFCLLDQFDMALAHAPGRVRRAVPHVPACYPEYNSGVIAFRSNKAVVELMQAWLSLYEVQQKQGLRSDFGFRLGDQAPLRELLYASSVRVATLPPEYNYRNFKTDRIAHDSMIRIAHSRSLLKSAVSREGLVDRKAVVRWFHRPQ